MIVVRGFITGAMASQGYGTTGFQVEDVDLAFLLRHPTVTFTQQIGLSVAFTLTQPDLNYIYEAPHGTVKVGALKVTFTMKYR